MVCVARWEVVHPTVVSLWVVLRAAAGGFGVVLVCASTDGQKS